MRRFSAASLAQRARRAWSGEPDATVVRVWGPHPKSMQMLALDAMYAMSLEGRDPAVRARTNPGSPYAGRFNGHLALQRFTPRTMYGQANAGLRIQPSSLPNTTGDSNPMLTSLFRAGI